MKKRFSPTAIVLSSLFIANMAPGLWGQQQSYYAPSVVYAAEKAATQQKIKGKITNISQKARTIALSTKKEPFFLIKFTENTTLKDMASSKELKTGEAVAISYTTVNGENIASSIQKAVVKLPAGVREIKTGALADILQDPSQEVVVIDARPPKQYEKGHIAGAVSIPYAKLKKAGPNGKKLLAKYTDRQLILYCGGST